jgi:C4-dicarboxylate transporter DctQ subunit
LQKLKRIVDWIERSVLVWTIVGLAVIGFIQVFCRYVFNYSFTWFEELGRYLGVFIAFLGAGIGAKNGAHFSMDLIVRTISQPYRRYLQCMISLMSSGFFVLITFYSGKIIARIYNYQSTSPTLGLPMYIAYLPIIFFSGVMAIRFLIKAIDFIQDGPSINRSHPRPVQK